MAAVYGPPLSLVRRAAPPMSVMNSPGSFDHLVGAREQRRGQVETESRRL
jgi:hypothetical protein